MGGAAALPARAWSDHARRPQREDRDLRRDAHAHRVAVEPHASRDEEAHVVAREHALIREADEADDGEGVRRAELHADVAAVGVARQHQIGGLVGEGVERQRVVVQ